ncbi:uncharacterized protein G2W53_015599 [Senna tora]|uniref:Uncharacterized protein n=1 Tax=Senna tora TaxID=362788 RepID=A0A835C8C6_9FABA|nr:uncharacterized protein G2W53_015599 [Senna tora]
MVGSNMELVACSNDLSSSLSAFFFGDVVVDARINQFAAVFGSSTNNREETRGGIGTIIFFNNISIHHKRKELQRQVNHGAGTTSSLSLAVLDGLGGIRSLAK